MHIPLRAFNLMPGAAFMVLDMPDPRVWIVEKLVRDDNFERVYIWAHDGTESGDLDLVTEKAFDLFYLDQVALVGLVANPEDLSDNDWGTRL